MEGGSSSPAASAASVEQVKVWLRIAGRGSAAQFEGPTNVGLFLDAVVDAKPGLLRDFLRAYRVPCDEVNLAAAEAAKSEADAEKSGTPLLPIVHKINADDYILVVQLQQAAPSSTTGKVSTALSFHPLCAHHSRGPGALWLLVQARQPRPQHQVSATMLRDNLE